MNKKVNIITITYEGTYLCLLPHIDHDPLRDGGHQSGPLGAALWNSGDGQIGLT